MAGTSVRSSALRRLRHRVGPWLDRIANAVAQPTTHVCPPGYVATVDLSIADLEAELRDGGFSWDPLSAYHYTPEGAARTVAGRYRSSPLADRQLHVVLFAQGPDRTDVYAHDEFSWLRCPIRHAREVDVRRTEGVAEMRRWLDARGLAYDRDSRLRREVRHAVERVRERLAGRGRPVR